MLRIFFVVIFILIFTGCATVSSVPSSVEEAKMDDASNGKVGWSRYQGSDVLQKIDKDTALAAARFGLNQSGFVIQKDSAEIGYVVGRHGMTMYDWNVICGVYIIEIPDGCKVKVIAQGSYDIGFAGDATGSDWAQDVLRYMRQFISSASLPK